MYVKSQNGLDLSKMKPKWQLAVFCAIHLLILAVVFKSDLYSGMRYSSIGLFFNTSSNLFNGQIPYRDFIIEYPPAALIFFSLPHLFVSSYSTYTVAFIVEIALFDLAGLVIISSVSRHLGLSQWKTLTVFTLALLAVGPIIINSYDLIPSMLVLLALYFFHVGKQKTAWVVLALGTMTKYYPVVIAPIFLLHHLYHRQYRQASAGVIVFVITLAAIVGPFLVLSPEGLWESFKYHIQRGLLVESTYSSFLLMGYTLGLTPVQLEFGFGSWQVVSPQADILARISFVLTFFCLAAIYWFFYRNQSSKGTGESALSALNQCDTGLVLHYSLLAIMAVMITGKVLSPQFIIWLYPLVPLLVGRWRYPLWVLFILVGIMTYYVFPENYLGLLALRQPYIVVLLCRNVLLICMAAMLLMKRTYLRSEIHWLVPMTDRSEQN